jgi:hypothetical protein
MRSRDGDHSLTLTVSILIFLLLPLKLSASEYLISYRYVVHNAILLNETLDISESMRPCLGTPRDAIIFENSDTLSLKNIIKRNEESFVAFLHKLGLSVSHHEYISENINDSKTILTLKTSCFKVDFNDTLVTIWALK